MKLDKCTVLSLNVVKTKFEPRTIKVSKRSHHSLSFRILGENTIIADGKSYASDAGAVTFVPARLSYEHQIHTPSITIAMHFTSMENIGNEVEVFNKINTEDLHWSLYRLWKEKPMENSVRCMALFYNILDILDRKITDISLITEKKRLDVTINHIYNNYCDSNFHVGDLHNMMFVSEAYYRRIFRRSYGCSPLDFLRKLRINHAKTLLEAGYHTVAEVAELSGFASIEYFSYAFKQATGQSPSMYRK